MNKIKKAFEKLDHSEKAFVLMWSIGFPVTLIIALLCKELEIEHPSFISICAYIGVIYILAQMDRKK